MVQVIINKAAHRVEIAFKDGYSKAALAGFDTQLRAAASLAKGHGSWFDILADFSDFGVMPQDTTDDGHARIAWCMANGLRRSANVTGSTIMKMQIERLAPDPRFQYFRTREQAAAWLDSPYSD
ncbi:hypothetical protein [Sphingobium algorifonticola]|uniref:STAS/SEC14 domain-containing protein n=1 Tax=Sphingobium algorifonticola TaxID=2008318 RepID=A0A437JC46_9SPHN|nr:hypothetical protein [Sphingobium algorifonticola]RVT43488.1 hypothetical protein ENE74_02355 [Sphingobium algorifonticola]